MDPRTSSSRTSTTGAIRLVSDDHGSTLLWDGLRISMVDTEEPPFELDAEIHEEDTALLLSADCRISATPQTLQNLATEALVAKQLKPGSVAVRPGAPTQLLAVIHDLDRDPTWRETWICSALRNALRLAEEYRFENLAIPLLGTAHGRIDNRRAVYLTLRTLSKRRNRTLKRVWLRVSGEDAMVARTELSERITK